MPSLPALCFLLRSEEPVDFEKEGDRDSDTQQVSERPQPLRRAGSLEPSVRGGRRPCGVLLPSAVSQGKVTTKNGHGAGQRGVRSARGRRCARHGPWRRVGVTLLS